MWNKSFTLIEVLAATFLLTVGAGAALVAVNQTSAFTQVTSSRLAAIYLAQEGIEIVKNIRDTNFLKINKGEEINWDDGLTGCASGCEADYNDTALTSGDRYLKIDGGFYNYDSGTDSRFKRKITISDMEDLDTPPDGLPDKMKIQALVSWEERGRSHEVIVQEIFYKWW